MSADDAIASGSAVPPPPLPSPLARRVSEIGALSKEYLEKTSDELLKVFQEVHEFDPSRRPSAILLPDFSRDLDALLHSRVGHNEKTRRNLNGLRKGPWSLRPCEIICYFGLETACSQNSVRDLRVMSDVTELNTALRLITSERRQRVEVGCNTKNVSRVDKFIAHDFKRALASFNVQVGRRKRSHAEAEDVDEDDADDDADLELSNNAQDAFEHTPSRRGRKRHRSRHSVEASISQSPRPSTPPSVPEPEQGRHYLPAISDRDHSGEIAYDLDYSADSDYGVGQDYDEPGDRHLAPIPEAPDESSLIHGKVEEGALIHERSKNGTLIHEKPEESPVVDQELEDTSSRDSAFSTSSAAHAEAANTLAFVGEAANTSTRNGINETKEPPLGKRKESSSLRSNTTARTDHAGPKVVKDAAPAEAAGDAIARTDHAGQVTLRKSNPRGSQVHLSQTVLPHGAPSHLARFLPGGWLSNNCIVFAHDIAHGAWQSKDARVRLLEATIDEESPHSRTQLTLRDSNKQLVFLVHLRNHWVAGLFDIVTSTVQFYDSLGDNAYRERGWQAFQRQVVFQSQETRHEILPPDERSLAHEPPQALAKQDDSASCGVFASVYCLALAKGKPLPTSLDVSLWRWILSLLASQSQGWPSMQMSEFELDRILGPPSSRQHDHDMAALVAREAGDLKVATQNLQQVADRLTALQEAQGLVGIGQSDERQAQLDQRAYQERLIGTLEGAPAGIDNTKALAKARARLEAFGDAIERADARLQALEPIAGQLAILEAQLKESRGELEADIEVRRARLRQAKDALEAALA